MNFFPVKDYSFLPKSTRKHLLTYIKQVHNELEGIKGEIEYSSKESYIDFFKNNAMNNLKINWIDSI